MTENFSLKSLFNNIDTHRNTKSLPSAHLWDPPFCGNIPLLIHSDGVWSYNGTPITRMNMVRLFASVLRKNEDNQYFLVTPYEKLGIKVEDVPFIMTLMEKTKTNNQSIITLTTQLNDSVVICEEYPLEMKLYNAKTLVPYIRVRDNLYGRIHRNLYYQILDQAEVKQTQKGQAIGLYSAGEFFVIENII